jgi:hypothetical protein
LADPQNLGQGFGRIRSGGGTKENGLDQGAKRHIADKSTASLLDINNLKSLELA